MYEFTHWLVIAVNAGAWCSSPATNDRPVGLSPSSESGSWKAFSSSLIGDPGDLVALLLSSDQQPLTQAMAALRRVARPGSLVVILSDFLGFSLAAQSYLSSVARHNEVLAVFLNDPIEQTLPPPGRYRLVADNDEIAIDTFAKPARREYELAFESRRNELGAFCQRYGVHLLPMSTEDDPVTALQTALGKRSR